ncbi:dynein axonemal heavy chain 6 [Phymastichus coffea]|uniref:dynein axonemal heavy chain 6 n=1 Tax=Phymastichus coffea TaxID=108790 RepID=UPI00273CB9F9|nr:dynein axonemal heavy chain 6 [Phymastichus coffea]
MEEFELSDGSEFAGDPGVRKRGTRVYRDESSRVLARGLRCEAPKKYASIKRKDEIDFYVPHKKLLREIEEKRDIPEPITGFLDKQEEIRRKVFKPYIPVPEVQDPPYEPPIKSQFIKQRPIKIVVQPKGKVLEMDSAKSVVSKSKPPVFADQLELIRELRNNPGIGFYYMIYAVDRSSEYFNPYALKVVPYKEVDKVYMTIGANGVTQYTPSDMTFTPIQLWEREYRSYLLLTKIRTFEIFRKWKAFNVWRKTIKYNKIMQARNYLEKNLFFCDDILRKALLEIRGMCSIFLNSSFVDTAVVRQLPLFYFVEMQFAKLERIKDKLNEFRRLSLNILNNTCLRALLDAGFTPDDSNITFEQTALGKAGGKARMPRDGVLKMSYIEQARKREKCFKLASFIHVADYYQLTMMQNFMRNTYMELLQVLKAHTDFLPFPEEFENLAVDYFLKCNGPSQSENEYPYFIVDLLINPELGIVLDPSESIFWHVLTTLQSMWEDTLKNINPLLSDEIFHPFTRPLINNKIEKPTCGDPPNILTVINEDPTLVNYKAKFKETFEKNFHAVKNYNRRFSDIRNFYTEDMEFNENLILENEKCDIFRKWCERYRTEEEEINSAVDVQPLGIFNVQLKRFKLSALPAPNQKQKVLAEIMPSLGKLRVDELLQEATEAIEFLNSEPVSTEDYADYIKFVDQALKKVDRMEVKLDYVKELYDIMEEYQFPVPAEDMANYLGISVYFTSMRLAVERQLENRTKLITKFNTQIHKDINLLIDRIQLLNDEVTQSWLLDAESNAYVCLETLNELNDRLTECANLANDYRSHQKAFKIEMTRFEILEQVQNEVKLRILLWQSLATWDETIAEWYEADFETLNVEDMNAFVMKNLKNIMQLEKGLPENNILPDLKEKVETMKDKMPIIGYLRNPNLRPRHWAKIELLLDYKFRPDEPINLQLLENLHSFAYANELMEISGAASSEAGLEMMLNKVEGSWKALDFIVQKHKDSKDVFVLGSLEEVQATLDDSNINIQTIAASRHVAPIKPRVDDWVKRLDLFSKTLESWQYCQQQWMYLEAIFSAPDIQRQLPIESKLFIIVDKSWKEIMRKTAKMPLALENCMQPGLYEQLLENNRNLDQILKCLEAYLETKRIAFPRFFFLSNDELLEILAQTRNPLAVQRHLQKCFDAIHRLEFAASGEGQKPSNDIVAMISPEGERVELGKGLKARGNVEDWLSKVESAMFSSLKKRMREAIGDFEKNGRQPVLWNFPSQIVLTVSQIFWATDVHVNLESDNAIANMQAFERQCFENLNELAAMVRGELPKLVRDVIINLITVDVHARDTISILVENKVSSSASFDWTKALRYYWDTEVDNCLARMSNAEYTYGYEYLGAQRRLVITPLTDKCYLCLMGALQLDLGGAPAGPAGTGKTETTKDLAKALAIQCVVFNCSEGLDYKMMGRFFSGLATSGAWCCFDEFNRIDIEVLSVIAQQLITIRNAKVARAKEFMFEGRKIKLVMTCAAFITMNPGYAGRTELPDNLKSLFRPVSMMVPDYKLIAEVTLYSEGFESSKPLSKKMTLLYTLCSEQLSQQDHYDFGMRAVKSVLVMAGSLKRDNPDKKEDVVLIRALRDSNLPKFLADDAELFQGILGDLFPGVDISEEDYGVLQQTAVTIMQEAGLQPEDCSIKKVIQLHETMRVRHGVMTVGPTGSGKSTVLRTLRDTYTRLHELGIPSPYYQKVHMDVLNPKAVTIGELYGEVNPASNEWHDGLLGVIIRRACASTTEDHYWVVCDGPVDAVWIENMNTVLDDNKMLCLANSERIKFTPYVHMVFEVADLAQASPATVSRCGMVYLDPSELRWLPRVKTWIASISEKLPRKEIPALLSELFESYVDDGLVFFRKNCDYAIAQVDISKADMLCALLESILLEPGAMERSIESSKARTFVTQAFVFAYLWAIGGNAVDSSRETFELFVRDQMDNNPDARLPPSGELWGLFINTPERRMDVWTKLMPAFAYDPEQPFFEILVPTVDTVRFGYVMQKLIQVNKPVLLTGGTGVGKSVIAKMVLNTLESLNTWLPIVLNFSAQTSSGRTQEILELKLEKKKKTILGAPVGKRVCVFVDDVNMPKLDTYGSQPPIELLRQILDCGGVFDKDKLFWKRIVDVVMTTACAPPGGGRNPLTTRFVRHFGMLVIPSPTEDSLKAIFRTIMRGFLKDFTQPIIDIGDRIVTASVEVYNKIAEDLLPTPEKSHYIFNLRDLSKCIQGILQADSSIVREAKQMLRLFYHECLRVFHDRLINDEDKTYFYHLLSGICSQQFGDEVIPFKSEDDTPADTPLLLFGDFMVFGVKRGERLYEEIVDLDKTRLVLQDYLDDYSLATSKEMNLIFFMDAIEHLCRLARILRSERGNGLLVGVGGMGKQSLTKLASHMNGYRCNQIEVSRGYDRSSWYDDLRRFYVKPGALAEPATFLFTDTQIVLEEFLEDINNTLNSGEVPNLFEAEELERAIIATRPAAKEAGISESNRDAIYQFFIGRVRNHLHLMLCMSPVGDAFRRRCRMFPSLVNCCTIDWFSKWPNEALLSVAVKSIGFVIVDNEDKVQALASICVLMHESVEEMTVKFFEEMQRRYYTTPSSYLDLLKIYLNTLDKKSTKINTMKGRIGNGLNKLKETNEMVAMMKIELIALGPQLKINSEEVAKLMKVVAVQQIECDKVRTVVAADEATAKAKADKIAALEAEARKDLEAALPALEEAQNALAALNKNDINEIKVFNKPPALVRFVMEAVCLLLGQKTDWPTAKLVLSDVRFLDRLMAYDKDNISDKLLKKLQDYVMDKDFQPDIVAKQSKVCKSICIWVRAVDGYAKIFRIVEPKRQRLAEAQIELRGVEEILEQKQQQLAAVEKQSRDLQNAYDTAVRRLADLEYNMALSEARLGRSGRLTSALADEEIRWIEEMKEFEKEIGNIAGDTLVAAGGLAYLGAFTSIYREQLLSAWLSRCQEQGIDTTSNFSLETVLADPYEIRMWNAYGLPRDQVSTENAILVTQAGRWPLMIDPQEQANRWIRNMEQSHQLKICKMTDSNFMRMMEACIRTGAPILLQEVGETLDPSLEPILLKQTFFQAGRTLIRLGDNDVEYDSNFRLYITTKMANPHYLPEICIKVTIINFTVTPSGLEDQLLADVVRLEKPELEKMRNQLIAQINADKTQLKNIEDKILMLLFSSEGNILDNEELIETLNESKETSAVIATRLVDSEATEQEISVAREKYRSAATRGSVLYFVVANLAIIDPMYQFSLKYFNQIVNNVIETSEKSNDLQTRLQILYDEITLAVYTIVSRGLFERHKIVFSFMMNIAIMLNGGVINYAQWNFLLRGPEQLKTSKKPDYPTLTDPMWNATNYLAENFQSFENIMDDMFKIIKVKIEYYEEEINILPNNNAKAQRNWDLFLTDIEKLMLLKALKEEKLIFGVTSFVKKNLGQQFVESPIITLQVLYPDTSKVIPLVFVLSTGSDPFSAFLKFAHEMGFTKRYESISLGQGQGPIAESLIRQGIERGDWVFLQNCHLATSWMLSLENLVIEISEDADLVHDDYRLFLSSMPSAAFPVSVLQNSVKVTNEPPKGLKANVKRAFFELEENFFENHELGEKWRRMIFGVCFFHAIIQERKKFGPLGWNIIYEFSDNDRECCLLNLQMFCVNEKIPWDALIYTTGEITYGGRITDNWDLRCLKTILEGFFSPKTLDLTYVYSPSGTYYCPSYLSLAEYREFIDGFPIIEDPEIFGMHENANIAYQLKESKTIMGTIMEVQPKVGASKEGKSESEIAYELADMIMEKIALKIDIDSCNKKHLKKDSADRLPSLTIVLLHEVERYNLLLKKIHLTMENLQRAIKGFVVMSEELENVFRSLVNNQVPQIWHAVNVYPSLKSLGSWIRDLELRIDFIKTWLTDRKPISFWLSGLSFPQGFITGMLQTHARKYNIPIDQLKLDFNTTNVILDQDDIEIAHKQAGKEVPSIYKNLQVPEDGLLIHGLYIDAGKWDPKFKILIDASKGEMNPPLPVTHVFPVLSLPENDTRYVSPLYKTSIRAGVLSTTGHSTNFVMPVLVPSAKPQSYWILKGTALLIQVTN